MYFTYDIIWYGKIPTFESLRNIIASRDMLDGQSNLFSTPSSLFYSPHNIFYGPSKLSVRKMCFSKNIVQNKFARVFGHQNSVRAH